MASFFTDLPLYLSRVLTRYRDWHLFLDKTNHPETAQRAVLKQILTTQAAARFGSAHRFAAIRTYEEFVRAVPVCTYEDLRSAIEDQALTGEPC